MKAKKFKNGRLKLIKFYADLIGRTLPVKKIVLFGSYAWGKPGRDSDVDLFVVMNSKKRPAERAQLVSELIYPRPFPMDIIVRTPKEVRKRLALGDFFVEDIIQKGKVLYEQRST